jgi:hypothetical protein
LEDVGGDIVSEGWVETSEKILDQMRKLAEKKDKDRLDMVQSLRFSLYALHRSILGWMNWVSNPDIMASFTQEELEKMNTKLKAFVEEFIKYDVEATQKGTEKGAVMREARQAAEEQARRSPEDQFYI